MEADMAKKPKPRTPEDALASAAALIAEHHDIACIVVPGRTKAGRSYVRWWPIGEEAAAESLMEKAVKNGQTAEQAEADEDD
jgi:hypothetical protein